jgi:hypothetical protein
LHSQAGVEYMVLNENDEVISTAVEGEADPISLEIDRAKLDSGVNHIRVRAGFKGCETQILSSEGDLTYTPEFTITVQEDISICLGEQAMLQASGAPAGGYYQWFDEYNTEIDSVRDNVLLTPPIWQETVFSVAGVSANGCISAPKSIHVFADSLETPVITLFNDTLFVQVQASYQWKKNGELITSATSPYYLPDEPGQYSVIATNIGCSRESEVYFYGIDPECQIDIVKPVANVKDICGDTIRIEIADSQAEVMYSAINGNDEVISGIQTGNGDIIILEVAATALDSGSNTIRIKAEIEECEPVILVSEINFNHTLLNITTAETVTVCEGEAATLKVSGLPQGGHYVWYNADGLEIEGATDAEFTTAAIRADTIVFVTGVHPNGCRSEMKKITITPLVTPVITIQDNILSANSPGTLQWKNNGQVITGAVDSVYVPLISGSYTVVASQGDCSKESAPFEYSITDVISQYSGEFVLNTFPVPATSHNLLISVQSSTAERVIIQIIDLTGKSVFESGYNFNELRQGVPVSPSSGHFSEGMYFIIATQGNASVRKRVVIKN